MPATREFKPVLGLIPAKRGSIRLPEKNIRPLGGKPLLGWAIDAARESGVIDRLVVSTEDEGVARIARECGAEVPFNRPMELARDPAGVEQVALHALEAMRSLGAHFRTLVILLPTCPFRTAADLRAAWKLFVSRDGRFLMSVMPYPERPFPAMRLGEDARLETMPTAWRANGALHILDVPAFEESRSYYAQPLLGYPMPRERSIDIDTEADWHDAERALAASK